MIRVLVVSENRLHGEGMTLRLSAEPGIRAVGPHESIRRTLQLAEKSEVDVVLVDVVPTPDNQFQLAAAVRTVPQVPFVAMAEADSEAEVLAWAEAGAAAIVDRKSSPDDLTEVLEAAMKGVVLCSPRVAGALLRRVQTMARDRRPVDGTGRLTQRERDVLLLLGHGMSNKQIARHLGLQLPTVKNHVHNIFEKLEVNTRAMAVTLARSLGEPAPSAPVNGA
jgi:two-component system, NarL family, nitrate/nitrite response regulator NarL